MPTRVLHHPSLLAALCALSLAGAHAQPLPNLPAFQTAGPVQYSCGGIGSDESTAMRDAMKDFPLSLLFASKGGDYLASLVVELQNAHGTVTRFSATSPVCLLRLPAGHYTVKATTQDGNTQTHTVDIGTHIRTLDFRY